MEAYHNRGKRERNELGSWRSERWSWRITLPMLCYRLTRLVVYGLCEYHQNWERERERVLYWRVCTVYNVIGGVHFTSVWVRRPNGFGQDQRDLLKFGTWIMFPSKSPAQTLHPQQQLQEARGGKFCFVHPFLNTIKMGFGGGFKLSHMECHNLTTIFTPGFYVALGHGLDKKRLRWQRMILVIGVENRVLVGCEVLLVHRIVNEARFLW